ncbi:MAG: GNAT family acetyltransferase [Burkholderiaceae bacterium]
MQAADEESRTDWEIRPFREADREAVIQLWCDCDLVRPWNDPGLDIDRKLTIQPEFFLVGVSADVICASVMAGFDGHRGWVNYLAVLPSRQGRGYGRGMMAAVEASLIAAGCPKLNLQVRAGNQATLAFYEALGFSRDPVTSLGKRLIVDDQK